MIIKVTYNVTDVYMSTTSSPVYINVSYGDGGGASVWGQITGTLSDQTDLQSALDGKYDNPTGTTSEYIRGDGTLATFPTIGVASEVSIEVRNNTGNTITKGSVVYINGALGNKPTIAKAIATGDNTSAQTLGVVKDDISNNTQGYVVVIGKVENLDTSAFSEGTQLYLSPTTAGAYTSTKPYAPYHLVYVGIVTRQHPSLGVIEVNIQNGYELAELHDVDALNPNNNDGIFYNSTSELWEHKSIASVLGYTPGQGTVTSVAATAGTGISISGSPITSSGTLIITNTAPDQVVSLTQGGTTTITGTYPNFTISSADQYTGTVTSIGLTSTTSGVTITGSPVTTSGSLTLDIATASGSTTGLLSSTDWTTFNNKQNALTNPVTGTGTSGQVAYWSGTNTQTGSATLTYTPTSALLVNNSVTASSAIARGINFTPTLVAAANNDVLVGLDVNPTFTNGAFSGVKNYAIRSNQKIYVTNSTSGFSADNASIGTVGGIYAGSYSVINNELFVNNTNGRNNGAFANALSIRMSHSSTSVTTIRSLIVERPSSTASSITLTEMGIIDANGTISVGSGSTVTNTFGIRVYPNTIGTNNVQFIIGSTLPTGNWGIYNTSTYANYLAGVLNIGTTTLSGFSLDVNGTARVQGDFTLSDTRNIILGTSTGTKIGTATSQKIGFWNATPIVQPTTAVAAATFTANTGTAVNDASTFDGYTMAQVVKALRNAGLLA